MWDRRIRWTDATAAYWAGQSYYSDADVGVSVIPSMGASMCSVKFGRSTPAGTREDLEQFNVHFVKVAAPGEYTYLPDGDKTTVEGLWDTFWTTVKTYVDSGITLQEFAWHDIIAGDAHYGPADRITSRSVAGTLVADRMPDQLAVDVTLRTSSRKHWGRFYIPGIGTTKYEKAYGRIANATCDAMSLAFRTLANSAVASSIEPVVFSKTYQAVLTIDEVRCDNVPDVIRRRRPKQASYYKSYTS